jgi:signal transduction histidine kinase
VKEGVPTSLDRDLDEAVEELLREGWRSAPERLSSREIAAEALVGGAFLVAAIVMAVTLPSQDSFSFGLAAVFVCTYALVTRIQFDVGAGYTVPTQLVFVPMLFALPARTVPLMVAAGLLLGDLPDYLRGERHALRALKVLGDSWYAVGPAMILALTGSEDPRWSDWPIYVGAFGVQLAIDFSVSALRELLGRGVAPQLQLDVLGLVYLIDVLLSPVGLLGAFASQEGRYAFLLLLPLTALFVIFARERAARIENALGLSRAYQETAELNARLLETERAATRVREDLVAAASHEMQTPVAVLLGLLESTMRQQRSPKDQAEMYTSMRRQAVRLRHLVRQFVDYARLKAGQSLQVDPRPSAVTPVIQDVADSHQGYGAIELDLPQDLPQVIVDPERLHQILMSLVSNAVKFSSDATARIEVRLQEGSLEIRVVDHGPGIDPGELPHLFEELPRAKEESDPATGLGLYLTRILCEEQGIRIQVESQLGRGSLFTVVIPL